MKSSTEDGSWIQEELSQANFSDVRLNNRFSILSEQLASQPSLPINQASLDWAASKAAYRFFENEKVTPEAIIAPHIKSTESRLQKGQKIIVVQDTTTLDFSKHWATLNLGPIAESRSGAELHGLFMHTTMAMSEKGLPLGLLDNNIWARKPQKVKGHSHTKIPLEEKESFKWFKGLRASGFLAKKQEVVMVCDREADIYELFEEAGDLNIDLVVRMNHDRITYTEDHEYLKITDELGLKKYLSTKVVVEVPGSGRRKPRQAELSIRFSPITLSSQPRGIKTSRVKSRYDIELQVVELHELKPPKGEKALVWYLLTSLDVRNRSEALEVMRIYKLRWQIEQYFKCLKTGCKIEDCRLNTANKLMNYISLMAVVAWRLLWMTHLRRVNPNLSCEVALTKNEWKALWLQKHKRQIKSGKLKAKPPKKPPNLGDAIKWIAMQGGFLGRKGDGDPGLITIWRGWIRLEGAAEMYALLKN